MWPHDFSSCRFLALRGGVMKIANAFLVIVLFALSLSAQGVWTPERQVEVNSVGGVRVSRDNKRVVYTVHEAVMTPENTEFVTQIWMADIDGSNQRHVRR